MMKNLWKAVHLILTLHCEESTRLMSDALDRRLSFAERWALRLHFISCWSCRRFKKHLQAIRTAAARLAERTEAAPLSSEARRRIEETLRNQAQG